MFLHSINIRTRKNKRIASFENSSIVVKIQSVNICNNFLQDDFLKEDAFEYLKIIFVKFKVICEHGEYTLNCPAGQVTLNSLQDQCENSESCLAMVENHLLGGDPCYGTYKYFTLDYTCGTYTIKF
jgi:hypothetical protein